MGEGGEDERMGVMDGGMGFGYYNYSLIHSLWVFLDIIYYFLFIFIYTIKSYL